MSDEEPDEEEAQSFRERVEEIRQQRAEEESPGGEGFGDPMGGGMGGNPFAQMMGGMMGGGPGGGGADLDTEQIVRELARLREQMRDATDELERIADALEDD